MFYSSLYDMANSRAPHVAQTLLQLHTLSGQGPILTALHAANAAFILDHCAKDRNFLLCVKNGYIQFRATPQNERPLEHLQRRLRSETQLYLHAWPELRVRGDPKRQRAMRALREVVAKSLASPSRPSRGIPATVLERIEHTRALDSAIREAERRGIPLLKENAYQKFGPLFESAVRKVVRRRRVDIGTRTFLWDLVTNKAHSTRVDIYNAVESDRVSPEIERSAKAVADGIKDVQIASSLDVRLHAVSDESIVTSVYDLPVRPSDLIAAPPISLQDVSALRLQWESIVALRAQYSRPPGSIDIDNAVNSLATLLGSSRLGVETAIEGAFKNGLVFVMGAAASLIGLHATETAVQWVGPVGEQLTHAFLRSLESLGVGAVSEVAAHLIKRRCSRRRKEHTAALLKGWAPWLYGDSANPNHSSQY